MNLEMTFLFVINFNSIFSTNHPMKEFDVKNYINHLVTDL